MYLRYCYLKSEEIFSDQDDVVKVKCLFLLFTFEIHLTFVLPKYSCLIVDSFVQIVSLN